MSTRVLVIEDEAPLLRLIVWSLIDDGFEVSAVTNIVAANDRLNEYQPDVIVFNTLAKEREKDAAMLSFRTLAPEVRIIDVSGEKNEMAAQILRKVGEDATFVPDTRLHLPFPLESLLDEVRRMTDGSAPTPV